MSHPSRPQKRPSYFGASVALTAVALATVITIRQAISADIVVLKVSGVVVLAHTLLWLSRRWSLAPIRTAAGIIGVCLFASFVASFGLDFLQLTPREIGNSISQMSETLIEAPPPYSESSGFVLTLCIMFVIAGIAADSFAFRRKLLFEAIVFHFAIFSFLATLGTGSPLLSTFLFMLSALVFSTVHIVNIRSGVVAHGTSFRAARAYLRTGFVLCLIVVAIVPFTAPLLPGYDDSAVIDVQNLGSGELAEDENPQATKGAVVAPDIERSISLRPQLVNQSSVELFTVHSSERHYWRQAVLEDYRDGTWKQRNGSNDFGSLTQPENAVAFKARFTINGLSSNYLPSPNNSSAISLPDASINPRTGEVTRPTKSKRGMSYEVTAMKLSLDPTQLKQAHNDLPIDVTVHDTSVTDISERVVQLASSIADGKKTSYEKALAVELYLRNNYQYDLSVSEPSSGNPLDSFLFGTKRGYCQQFAGSFALLARSVGIPTRIAVGYTPGELGNDNLLHVSGAQAHAWPEVFLGQFGWVPFEPTPTRGIPGASSYTNVIEQQVDPLNPSSATTLPTTTTSTATTAQTDFPAASTKTPDRLKSNRLSYAIVLMALTVLGMVSAIAWRRRRRRKESSHAVWRPVEHALTKHRLVRSEGETRTAFARRCNHHLAEQTAQQLLDFTALVEYQTFGAIPTESGEQLKSRSELLASQIRKSPPTQADN